MIAISIMSRAGMAAPEPHGARFDEAGGVVGRGEDCTLVLPDAERRISRKQLKVSCHEGRYFVRALSASVAVQVDGRPAAIDVDHPVEPGSRIRVGPYLLEVTTPAEAEDTAAAEIDLVVGETIGPHVAEGAAAQAPAEPVMAAQPVPPARPMPPVQAAAAAATEEPLDPQLVAALYAGLGRPLPAHPDAAQLRLVGQLLRTSVEGILALLAARSIAKRELGADPTMPQVRENNPLKFSPDVDAALAHLLGPPHRGFLPPRAAVDNAFDDLRAHEVAMLTGMRAAVDAMLARFDPRSLKHALAPKAGWQQLLPAARKAELWDSYERAYARIVEEIDGDFDTQFARAFLKAYQQQIAQLNPGLAPRNGTTDSKD